MCNILYEHPDGIDLVDCLVADRGGKRSKAYSWSPCSAGNAASNPAEGMDICLLCLFCVA